ncbi:MAG: hypothetical protein K2O77_04260 [Limosilactobacillus sp.]|uniref:hypothetical protein n=1 Tax=Limosilactobacillus sp. TaxID=2773925 RepID=UPI0023CE5E88|nr:hypothetical protein [Limosilactobacillus sp.]MDE7040158.1 hypothetical protein [Limosilactobacillus sp.]
MIIINIVMTLAIFVLIGVVLKLPEYITKSWLEETKNKNAHNIQIESYFKQLGGQQQQEILSIWTEFLTDIAEATKNIQMHKALILSKDLISCFMIQ